MLKVAHTWGFDKVRELSITQLSRCAMDEVTKVHLAQLYRVKEWYIDAYCSLVKRSTLLTLDESVTIGWVTTVKIASLRERRYSTGSSCYQRHVDPDPRYYWRGSPPAYTSESLANTPVPDHTLRDWVVTDFNLRV